VLSTLLGRVNGTCDGTESKCKFCVKLQISPTGQTPVHGVDIKEFPQAKDAMDVKVQDQNNVELLFCHQVYHPP
jgi:hypothetical protein